MQINIFHPNGRSTDYEQSALRKDAQFLVRGKGKLESFWINIREGTTPGHTVQLAAQWRNSDGVGGTEYMAI